MNKFLNKITMYQLLKNGLFILVTYSIILGFLKILPYGGLSYIYSFFILTVTCYLSNLLFSKIFRAPLNAESSSISALILFFIMMPATSLSSVLTLVLVGLLAMTSKYILAFNKRHIFNPVAIAAFLLAVFNFHPGFVIWWVGSIYLFPAVLILGLLVVRKIRKFFLLGAFLIGTIISILIIDPSLLLQNLISYPLIFFGTIMLTEPFTLPTTKKSQIMYGFIVGILITSHYHFGYLYSTPELALVIGNVFSYYFSLKRRLILTLNEKKEISTDTFEFSFTPDHMISFKPGQYLEWTLPHEKYDERGVRRYFTIASSPTESDIKLGIKFYKPSSTFKQQLGSLKKGDSLVAGQLSGDFVMPQDSNKKLVFIAGGIGVTPFRSMIKYLLDINQKRDITLIYGVSTEAEIAYRDIFNEAEQKIGLKTNYLVKTFLSEDIIKQSVPDYKERIFYLSGPNMMVENYRTLLIKIGINPTNIFTDYFPGF